MSQPRNVLNGELEPCSLDPATGFQRDGCCRAVPGDTGMHLVCAQVTREFLDFSRSRGNDLSTPRPELDFPGLQPGDRWCLCVDRWREALGANDTPPVVPEATHISVLEYVDLEVLRAYALDSGGAA